MRKRVYALLFAANCIIFALPAAAQDFLGIGTGNYAGVTGVMLQPASIVDSRFRFDVNLFSTGINYSNNYLLVNRDAVLKFNKDDYGNYNTFKEKYLAQAALGANEKAYFNITNRTQLPAFMATTGKKSAIAVNVQSRSMIQGRDIPQGLASVAFNGFTPGSNTASVDASGFNILALNWIEVGLTYGRVIYSDEKSFLKVAFTGKYLGGVSSLYLGSNDLRMGINRDSTFNFITQNTQYSHNANAGFNNIFDRDFSPDASSFGFDAGLVYEYRGNIDRFKYISGDDGKSYEKERRDVNKYTFKLGMSLLDAGRFNFNKPAGVGSFSANTSSWDIHNQHFNKLSDFDTALAHRSSPLPNDPRSYSVYLPTAMSIQLDVHFVRGFYLNLMSYNQVKLNNRDYRFNNYDYYTITPRWESRNIGIYVPYTFGNHQQPGTYKDNLLGATLRLGPVFVGSSNLGTMAFNKNLKAADVHVGLKIGLTYGRPNRASMFFDKLSAKNKHADENDAIRHVSKNKNDTIYNNNTAKKPSGLIVDYKNGQIYSEGNPSGNVIIVNNYYYGNNAGTVKDSPANSNVYDTGYRINDSVARINYKYDSTQRILNDSLNEKKARLDSLIRNMQQLRKDMDSSTIINYNDTIIKTTPKKTSTLKAIDSSNTAAVKITNRSKTVEQTTVDTTTRSNNTDYKDRNQLAKNPGDRLQQDNQQRYLPNQKEGIVFYGADPADNKNHIAYQKQQNRDYDRYVNESDNLQREIEGLQREIDRQRRNTNRSYYYYTRTGRNPDHAPVVMPATGNRDNMIYVRDTVYIRDTTRVYDTLILTKNKYKRDTLLKAVPTGFGTVNPNIDYTNLPSDFVLFPTGRSAILPIYYGRLDYISDILKKQPGLYCLITGHTDATGSLKINEALSLKRAETVKLYLVNKGVKADRLVLNNGYSTGRTGKNKGGNAENRRTDIKVSNTNK